MSHVVEQVAEISQASFSLHEVLQARAVRMPSKGSEERKEIERRSMELVAAAQLAPVVPDDAEVMVTVCSHNTAGLKAICAGGELKTVATRPPRLLENAPRTRSQSRKVSNISSWI